jgi:hypothetical protein
MHDRPPTKAGPLQPRRPSSFSSLVPLLSDKGLNGQRRPLGPVWEGSRALDEFEGGIYFAPSLILYTHSQTLKNLFSSPVRAPPLPLSKHAIQDHGGPEVEDLGTWGGQ